jgi:hypothetical protein
MYKKQAKINSSPITPDICILVPVHKLVMLDVFRVRTAFRS